MSLKSDRTIMYIMVVGFHHKKGCQLEYVYPCDSLIRKKSASSDPGDLYELPKKWKHMPSLALPDGSHNYDQDYVYFHLEDSVPDQNSKKHPNNTIFGVSCYRQIDASQLLKKDSEVTRNTLQKSVCILSREPIYSSLRLKLHSITTAYFAQKDFQKTQILKNAFDSLCVSYAQNVESSKNADLLDQKSKYLMGLSLADLVLKYQHKILILFKLILLQKKCLYQVKPVSNLSNTIMALVSLIPDIYSPTGLQKSSGYFDSIDLVNSELNRTTHAEDNFLATLPSLDKLSRKMHKKALKKQAKSLRSVPQSISSPAIANQLHTDAKRVVAHDSPNKMDADFDQDADFFKLAFDDDKVELKNSKLDLKTCDSANSLDEEEHIGEMLKNKVNNVISWSGNGSKKSNLVRSESVNSKVADRQLIDVQLTDLLEINFGMPLFLFNEFNILQPYLSLHNLDYFMTINKMNTKLYCTTALMMNMMKENRKSQFIEDEMSEEPKECAEPVKKNELKSVGYTIGATNILFKQRLYDDLDAFIDDCEIDLKNNENLKKVLQLSTADLRFTDYLIKNVNAARSIGEKLNTPTLLSFKKTLSYSNMDKKDSNDMSSQSSTWEGSDDWIRLNFKWYLYTLLGSIVKEDACLSIKNDLENILVGMNSELSSSSSSLDNEVVDIEEYIEKVNSNGTLNREAKKNRKNSSSSASTISSSQYFYVVNNANFFSNYREDFNSNFVNELKKTDCMRRWLASNRTLIEKNLFKFECERMVENLALAHLQSHRFHILFQNLQDLEQVRLSHPFNGQMSVSDIKLKFNFLFSTTESGRKINKALAEGSKLVNNTGRVFGDAFNHAKLGFNSFFGGWGSGSSDDKNSSKKAKN
ncbi:late secretory pathway AVL9-like protein [Brachionus plicatilis]|uniref:Late secretory pathway AVL9-like protein n=1 Tax=Brachionus plicatilis TaxID=10195 RepID=A0A3M7S6I9_BRAPC|nr:late secretory pathway AVL9-like protein [Brachionus plicatilis]